MIALPCSTRLELQLPRPSRPGPVPDMGMP